MRDLLLHVVMWVAVSTTPSSSFAQGTATPEYQLKAVFLFNFAQFVDWPSSTFPAPDSPLAICILGQDPFGAYLDETVRGEAINGRPLAVRRYQQPEEATGCQILFISRKETDHLPEALDSLEGHSILTVSDADRFTSLGGMIRFVTEHNRIRLHINLGAAKAANLTISSKLLRPAQIVSKGGD